MITNLFGATLAVARNLGIVSDGTATGGSTTTVIDTNGRKEADGYWAGTGDNTGAVWITYDAGGAAAAPQGEYKVVSAFSNLTSTITLRSALTAAVVSGDEYAVSKRRFPLFVMIQSINQALHDLGTIPYTDVGTITMVSGQSEYNLPGGTKLDLREVYLQTHKDSVDNIWVPVYDWKIQHSDIGTVNKLILPSTIPGYAVKVVYMSTHPSLRIATDKISENVHPDRVVYAAASKALIWYRNKTRSSERSLVTSISEMEQRAAAAASLWPIPEPPRRGKLMIVGQPGRSYPGDRNPR